jgi:hypothetical protein
MQAGQLTGGIPSILGLVPSAVFRSGTTLPHAVSAAVSETILVSR